MIRIVVNRNFNLRRQAVRDAVGLIFNVNGDQYLDFLKRYPSQKNPDSLYIRGFGMAGSRKRTSEDLGARWNKTVTVSRLEMEIGNNASYAPYVQDEILQASVHRGWWQTTQDAVDRYNNDLTDDLTRLVTEYVVE